MNPHDLWQNQPTEPVLLSLDEVRTKARKFEQSITRRNRREYIAVAIVVIVFIGYAVVFPGLLVKIGAMLTAVGALFVSFHLHRKGQARQMTENLALSTTVEFHRAELERQRDLLRSVWLWNVAPLVPGMGLFLTGLVMSSERPSGLGLPALLVWIAAMLGLMIWLNHRAANKLQQKIDALHSMER